MAQVVEQLPSKHKVLGSNSSTEKKKFFFSDLAQDTWQATVALATRKAGEFQGGDQHRLCGKIRESLSQKKTKPILICPACVLCSSLRSVQYTFPHPHQHGLYQAEQWLLLDLGQVHFNLIIGGVSYRTPTSIK
jgi:hypothetical protein